MNRSDADHRENQAKQHPAGTAPPMLPGGYQWLRTGGRALAKMLEAIGEAKTTIRLEMYTIQPGQASAIDFVRR